MYEVLWSIHAARDQDRHREPVEPNGNLCFHLSLCSVNNSTQSYTTYVLSVTVSVLVSGSVNTPLVSVADMGDTRNAPGQNFFLFMQFSGRIDQIVC